MPELPEVETIRRDLSRSLMGQKIEKVNVLGESSVRPQPASFQRRLKGLTLKSLERRGKLLMVNFDKDNIHLLVHLKMTGQLIHTQGDDVLSGEYALSKLENGLTFEQTERSDLRHEAKKLPDTWTRVYFDFDDGSQLFFNDIRRFGYLALVDSKAKAQALSRYGIEPLTDDFTLENFVKIFKGRKTVLKSLLLNQQLVAGLGNIYVDEICFYAGVRPSKRVNRLRKVDIEKLFEGCEKIISLALKNRGTSFSDYRDAKGNKGKNTSALKSYGRVGKPCFDCDEKIVKIKLSGRGTTYCPKCQR